MKPAKVTQIESMKREHDSSIPNASQLGRGVPLDMLLQGEKGSLRRLQRGSSQGCLSKDRWERDQATLAVWVWVTYPWGRGEKTPWNRGTGSEAMPRLTIVPG